MRLLFLDSGFDISAGLMDENDDLGPRLVDRQWWRKEEGCCILLGHGLEDRHKGRCTGWTSIGISKQLAPREVLLKKLLARLLAFAPTDMGPTLIAVWVGDEHNRSPCLSAFC